jgi:long-chain acyl-CoA synthetase
VTWAEVDRRSAALATLLHEHGLRPGDTVLVLLRNDVRWAEVLWACWRSGLVVAPVSTHLRAGELRPMIDLAAPRAVVTGVELADRVEVGPEVLRLAVGAGYDEAVAAAEPDPAVPDTMGGRLLFSSGTTGSPKAFREDPPGVPATEIPLRYAAMMRDIGMVPGPGDRPPVLFSPGPAYHTAPMGFLQAIQQLGGTVVLAERFDAEGALAALERHAVTHSLWVPTMFVRMLRLPAEVRARYDLSAHRVAVHGAAPCPPEVKRAMLDWWGPIVHEYYGSSEGYGRTSIGPDEWRAHPGSVGRAKGGSVRIADAAGRDLPVGETGKVWLVRPDADEPRRAPDGAADLAATPGWGCAGDVGRVDADGYLYLQGRSSRVIISGGVNVHPQEIEDLLALHPAVADVAVVGAPDEEYGERVVAFVQPLGPPDPDLAFMVREYCRERLAHVKCPREVVLVDRVPRSAAGKILARELPVTPLR